ncbi:MAG TPA: glycosyltransferase [candidate division Zixibacteria bacterium]|nr:glycosyltransferase [candidate division Zixibacteria bacterium]
MISIVCAYNDPSILNAWLLSSLKTQTAEYEIIAIDTLRYGFQSAAEALNFGGARAKGKYIMFVHQDVTLDSEAWLEKAEKLLEPLFDLGIAGVMGSVEEGNSVAERIRNVIRHGNDMELIGNPISSPERVQTLDELLLIVPREVFQEYQFDENTCSDWHLYGTDYCLSMLTSGRGVYVIPLFVTHKSKGALTNKPFYNLSFIFNFGLSSHFFQTLGKVLKKHKQNFAWIYTTPGYGKWKTTGSLFTQRLKYSIIEMLKWFAVRMKGC